MCKSPEAERILIARHPILRIISAWNDKFNMNNTDPAGIPMGLSMLLKTQMGQSFQTDVSFLKEELNVSDIESQHCLLRYYFCLCVGFGFSVKTIDSFPFFDQS